MDTPQKLEAASLPAPTLSKQHSHTAPLSHTLSHTFSTHDMPMDLSPVPESQHLPPAEEDGVYNRFSLRRKAIITAVLAFCGFLAPVSSTMVLAAVPEVAATFETDGTIINLSNALYMLFMGISPTLWGPIGQTFGRRKASIISAILFTAFSAGTALSPNLASFYVFRILTALQGTSFLVLGSSCIGDIYKPTERATALGWFLSGTLIGPAFGPFVAGIIVTFKTWPVIFWFQTALGGTGSVLVFFLLPETIHYRRSSELAGLTKKDKAKKLWAWTNPWRVIRLYKYPNLLAVCLVSSSLVWNMYSLLTPIRYVLNPRFHLTSPLQSGLFYIAPGCGYLFGTFFGGRWADIVVKRWIIKRNGERVPEDRLRSCMFYIGVALPASMLVYGWSVEKRVGGVALPVIVMWLQGVAQLMSFPSLNTYCLDVMQGSSAEVIAGNYMIRYIFAALGSALCLPAVRVIGVGWFSTISAAFLIIGAVVIWATTTWGKDWRERVDRKESEESQGLASNCGVNDNGTESKGQEQQRGGYEDQPRDLKDNAAEDIEKGKL